MKRALAYLKTAAHLRSVVALALGSISLVVLLVAFQLNFQQRQLYTQIIRYNAAGEEEKMIFRDYRDQQAEQVEKMLADCLERNDLFGDGTGEVCEIHREQLNCVRKSFGQDRLLECLN